MKSSPPPGLPTWLFILTDLALLGTAAVVAWASPLPLSTGALIAIVGCVLLGVLLGLVPLVVRLERRKNEALDERQRALEALAETVRESAQQVSIATGSLHGIAELARRTLRETEQLPERLQERVSAFQGQLAEAEDGARAALEEELAALRASELGRIEAALNQLSRTASELTRLEAAAAKQLGTLQREAADSAAQLGRALAAAREEDGALLETRLREARAGLAAAVEEANTAGREASRKLLEALDERLARLAPAAPATVPETPAPVELTPEAVAPVPRKPRRPRREETVGSPPAEAEPSFTAVPVPVPAPAAAPAPEPEATPPAVEAAPDVPAPAPSPALPEPVATALEEIPAAPVAPAVPVAAPEPEQPAPERPVTVPVAEPVPSQIPAPVEPEVPPPAALPRKRPARRPDPEPTLEFGFEDSPPAAPGSVERTLTSDGATRLLVTAYIGIGNRLFIRGDGPGLSWERGVPLQFISIGKWRWETGEAGAPIRFRIYKNDELECAALGEQVLDPGYLQEVTASF